MPRSFDIVDNKVAEAEFFFERITDRRTTLPHIDWYLSAFVSAARSITFSLQAALTDIPGFTEWYSTWQERLRAEPLARYFTQLRNAMQKIGWSPVNRASVADLTSVLSVALDRRMVGRHWFGTPGEDLPPPPEADVDTACRNHFVRLLEMVYDCYVVFGPVIDPHQHYTLSNFARLGKTIEDAEEELFGLRGWTATPDVLIEYRWQAIRDTLPGCQIDYLFDKYLGCRRPAPERLPELPTPKTGWVYVPPSLRVTGSPDSDVQLFIDSLADKPDV